MVGTVASPQSLASSGSETQTDVSEDDCSRIGSLGSRRAPGSAAHGLSAMRGRVGVRSKQRGGRGVRDVAALDHNGGKSTTVKKRRGWRVKASARAEIALSRVGVTEANKEEGKNRHVTGRKK